MSDGIESQNLRRVMRQNMRDKLPEWPEKPHGVYGTSHDWLNYHALVTYAALARMEALAAEVEQLRDEFLIGSPRHAEWLDIINALLAACERRKS